MERRMLPLDTENPALARPSSEEYRLCLPTRWPEERPLEVIMPPTRSTLARLAAALHTVASLADAPQLVPNQE